MNLVEIPPPLRPLTDYLSQLVSRPPLDELIVRLRATNVTLDDVKAYVHFQRQDFCCTLIAEGRWYRLEVRCWRNGQRSPVIEQGSSAGVFKVLAGICHLTMYDYAPNGQMLHWHPTPQPAGALVVCQGESLSRISNLHPLGHDLVTLHVYAPPPKPEPREVQPKATTAENPDSIAFPFTD